MIASRIDTSVFSFSPVGDANEVEFTQKKVLSNLATKKSENQNFKHPSQFFCYMIEPNREIWWLENPKYIFLAILEKTFASYLN
jgi:hypothetical protein